MGFDVPENVKIAYLAFLAIWANCQTTYIGHFSQKIKIFEKPVRMVLEGLKYKKIAFGTLARAHDRFFAQN